MGLRPVAASGTSPPPGRAGLSLALCTRASKRGPLPAAVEAHQRISHEQGSDRRRLPVSQLAPEPGLGCRETTFVKGSSADASADRSRTPASTLWSVRWSMGISEETCVPRAFRDHRRRRRDNCAVARAPPQRLAYSARRMTPARLRRAVRRTLPSWSDRHAMMLQQVQQLSFVNE